MRFVARRHLLVTGNDAVYHYPVASGYLFLQALMVRNSEQIIGVVRLFLVFPGTQKVVILWVSTKGGLGAGNITGQSV